MHAAKLPDVLDAAFVTESVTVWHVETCVSDDEAVDSEECSELCKVAD